MVNIRRPEDSKAYASNLDAASAVPYNYDSCLLPGIYRSFIGLFPAAMRYASSI